MNKESDIKILYEDENILAINKPAGLVVHGDGKEKNKEETLVDWLLEKYPEISEVGESMFLNDKNKTEIKRQGIVHRLDRDTSGVMIIAKTKEGFEYLKNIFKNREVEKTYNAFVYGNIREDELVIKDPIGRSSKNIRRWTAGKDARGEMREAETFIKVLNRIVIDGPNDKAQGKEHITFVEAKPKTGRTHQIRVHLNHIGRPILCDSLYTNRDCLLGFNRVALHAKSISFKNLDGKNLSVEAPFPDDFNSALSVFADLKTEE